MQRSRTNDNVFFTLCPMRWIATTQFLPFHPCECQLFELVFCVIFFFRSGWEKRTCDNSLTQASSIAHWILHSILNNLVFFFLFLFETKIHSNLRHTCLLLLTMSAKKYAISNRPKEYFAVYFFFLIRMPLAITGTTWDFEISRIILRWIQWKLNSKNRKIVQKKKRMWSHSRMN